jgi:hypothetical protein
MKSILGLLVFLAMANTQAASLDKACLSKVVTAVNKHHILAEGSVYALRFLFQGEFAAALLVGHSDETDPTDYLVTVDKTRNCSVKSIVVTNESSDVVEYTKEEGDLVNEIYKEQEKALIAKALELIEKVPQSGYDVRTLCITDSSVTAIYPRSHWSEQDQKIATGNLTQFPIEVAVAKPPIKILSKKLSQLVSGNENNGIYLVHGTVDGKVADICLLESKPVLE